MKQITESFHEYKGYTIRLRAVTYNGFWYTIMKQIPTTTRKCYLHSKGWNFIEASELLQKAKNYIDNFSDRLDERYSRDFNKFMSKYKSI